MKDEGKFRVRMKGSWAWVGGLEKDAENLTVTIVKDDEPPVVFGPRDRKFWESQSYWLEIVPEPPPFVFPPTPWGDGRGCYCVDASGNDAFPLVNGPVKAAIWAEVRRRVNWHDRLVEFARAIKEAARGYVIVNYAIEAGNLLDEMDREAKLLSGPCPDHQSPDAPIGAKDGE